LLREEVMTKLRTKKKESDDKTKQQVSEDNARDAILTEDKMSQRKGE
jgi:hypothetical protein